MEQNLQDNFVYEDDFIYEDESVYEDDFEDVWHKVSDCGESDLFTKWVPCNCCVMKKDTTAFLNFVWHNPVKYIPTLLHWTLWYIGFYEPKCEFIDIYV